MAVKDQEAPFLPRVLLGVAIEHLFKLGKSYIVVAPS
jgi:hypothetical protein